MPGTQLIFGVQSLNFNWQEAGGRLLVPGHRLLETGNLLQEI